MQGVAPRTGLVRTSQRALRAPQLVLRRLRPRIRDGRFLSGVTENRRLARPYETPKTFGQSLSQTKPQLDKGLGSALPAGIISPILLAWLQHHFIWCTQRTADVRKLVFDEAVKAIAMFEADALNSAGGSQLTRCSISYSITRRSASNIGGMLRPIA